MFKVASNLINAVENHLKTIGRSDYTQNYYDWEFHLIANNTVNAFCMPGGKIVVLSGLSAVTKTEDELAFILGHEMAHALLDHSRTQVSARKTKDRLATGARLGSIALSLAGFGTAASATRLATNVADIGSEYFLMKPWGRDQELEADKLGMMIVHWAGYDISRIPSFWQKMSNHSSNNFDFFSTHPSDDKRIAGMKNLVLEIENQKDFYSRPVMEESPKSRNVNQIETSNSLQTKICTNCGHEEDASSIFCTNCGNKFEVESKCPNCGYIVDLEDKFCTNCGFKLH